MSSLRLNRLAPAVASVICFVACSTGNDHPLLTTSSAGGAGGGTSSITTSVGTGGSTTTSSSSSSTGNAGGAGATGGMGGSGGAISTLPNDLGDVPVFDEVDVPCVQNTAATPITVYPAGASPAAFDRLEQVGTAWMASGTAANGFVLFEADGSNASAVTAIAPEANLAATTGPRLGVAGISAGTVLFEEYDSTGAQWLPTYPLGTTDGARVAVGGWSGKALVVWQDLGTLRANGVSNLGHVELPFTLAGGLVGSSVSASVASAQVGFAVAWSHESAQYKATTSFAFVTTQGIVGPPLELTGSQRNHTLVRVVRNTVGYALLFNGQDATSGVYIISIDDNGQKLAMAHRLLGAKRVWDIAALGDKLGVIATLANDTLAFRPLDAFGHALGPWVCLGAPSSDPNHMAGIAALGTGTGYQIIARGAGGSEYILGVDALGTGTP